MANVTTSFLEREYALSPVPVLECSRAEWRKFCKSKGIEFGNGYGGYYYDICLPNSPPGLVVINCDLPNYKRLAVFYHEKTHIECKMNNCCCFTEYGMANGLCEHHAQVGAIFKCLKQSQESSLAFSMKYVNNLVLSCSNRESNKGAKMTIKHRLWDYAQHRLTGTVAPLSELRYTDLYAKRNSYHLLHPAAAV